MYYSLSGNQLGHLLEDFLILFQLVGCIERRRDSLMPGHSRPLAHVRVPAMAYEILFQLSAIYNDVLRLVDQGVQGNGIKMWQVDLVLRSEGRIFVRVEGGGGMDGRGEAQEGMQHEQHLHDGHHEDEKIGYNGVMCVCVINYERLRILMLLDCR